MPDEMCKFLDVVAHANNAGIINPDQVKRKILLFPINLSVIEMSKNINQKDSFLPIYREERTSDIVINSMFGPRSNTVLSRNARKNSMISSRYFFEN